MFNKDRYVTTGVCSILSQELQIILWSMIENLQEPKDYLQVFELIQVTQDKVKIVHRQEEPEYKNEICLQYSLKTKHVKIFVIDDGEYATMLLANEY